jgi:hypothetical protein
MAVHAMPMRTQVPRVAPPTTGDQTMTNNKTIPVVGTSRGKPITAADIERMNLQIVRQA